MVNRLHPINTSIKFTSTQSTRSSPSVDKMDIDDAKFETVKCSGCGLTFPSKNQLFRHLADSTKTCLSPEDFREYLTQVPTAKRYWEKIAVLYGYLPGTDYRFGCSNGHPCGIEGGQVKHIFKIKL